MEAGPMNLRLQLRMILPTAALGLLLLGIGVGAAWYVHRLQQNVSETLLINVASVRAAEELEISVREVRSRLDRYLAGGNRAHLDALPELRRETDRWLTEAD